MNLSGWVSCEPNLGSITNQVPIIVHFHMQVSLFHWSYVATGYVLAVCYLCHQDFQGIYKGDCGDITLLWSHLLLIFWKFCSLLPSISALLAAFSLTWKSFTTITKEFHAAVSMKFIEITKFSSVIIVLIRGPLNNLASIFSLLKLEKRALDIVKEESRALTVSWYQVWYGLEAGWFSPAFQPH